MLYVFFWVIPRREANLGSPFYTSLRKGDNHLQHNSFDLPSHGHPNTSHSLSHTPPPRPPCGSLPLHNRLCELTYPYPVTLLLIGLSYFQANPSVICIHRLFSNLVIIYLLTYEDETECFETSAYKIQTPGNYPEESLQHLVSCLLSITYFLLISPRSVQFCFCRLFVVTNSTYSFMCLFCLLLFILALVFFKLDYFANHLSCEATLQRIYPKKHQVYSRNLKTIDCLACS
jgi:hypothetical protein